MKLWLFISPRWRVMVCAALLTLFVFDALVFIGIPGFKIWGLTLVEESVDSVRHVQAVRRSFNVSSSNSSSLYLSQWWSKKGFNDHDIANTNTVTTGDQVQKDTENVLNELFENPNNKNKEDGSDGETFHETIFENQDSVTYDIFQPEATDVLRLSAKPNVTQGQLKSQDYGAGVDIRLQGVEEFVAKFQIKYATSYFTVNNQKNYTDLLNRLNALKKKGSRLPRYINNKGKCSWEKFHYGIHQNFLYDPDDIFLSRLLHDLGTKKIVSVEQKEGGTQIKLIVTFEDGGQALFKPMRFGREQETLPDHFYFSDFERHNAEIAAFHLDKILGFYRVPPTIGRLLNVSRDIQNICDIKLAKTFFVSPAGNLCFHGSCSYYCDSSHPVCGHPIMLEGSLAVFLPPKNLAKRKTWRNPWKRSYSKHRKAYWETNNDLCEKVKQNQPYNEGRRLLDVLDMSVFDFLTGNLDRHHYETFRDFGNDTFLLHLDNGRAFGKSKYDCMSCLAPVWQCCMIRLSTLTKLVKLYIGPNSLSQLMRSSLALDPLNPILVEPHLDALDRRVSKILHVIHQCIVNGKLWDAVIIDDGVR